jgi:hypothetical protein
MPYLNFNALINAEKITNYLLIPLPKDDKSQFLAKAGYTLDNWQQLEKVLENRFLLEKQYLQ